SIAERDGEAKIVVQGRVRAAVETDVIAALVNQIGAQFPTRIARSGLAARGGHERHGRQRRQARAEDDMFHAESTWPNSSASAPNGHARVCPSGRRGAVEIPQAWSQSAT